MQAEETDASHLGEQSVGLPNSPKTSPGILLPEPRQQPDCKLILKVNKLQRVSGGNRTAG